MKWCTNCGKELADDAKFCSGCGTAVAEPQIEAAPQYEPQPAPQPAPQQTYTPAAAPDEPNVGMNILCFLIPLVGLILYLTEKDKTPIKAKSMGKWALIGFIANTVLSILFAVLSFVLALLPSLFYYW